MVCRSISGPPPGGLKTANGTVARPDAGTTTKCRKRSSGVRISSGNNKSTRRAAAVGIGDAGDCRLDAAQFLIPGNAEAGAKSRDHPVDGSAADRRRVESQDLLVADQPGTEAIILEAVNNEAHTRVKLLQKVQQTHAMRLVECNAAAQTEVSVGR